jgi:hypothetical protein
VTVPDDRMLVQLTVAEMRELIRTEVELLLKSTPPLTTPRWIKVEVAAKYFGCTPMTIRNWIGLGAPAAQIGAASHPQYRIELAKFEAWVRDYKKEPGK